MTHPTPPAIHETAPKARPGLLVEDRNSAVRTSADGAQTVVKTADRAAEAARQGVAESQV